MADKGISIPDLVRKDIQNRLNTKPIDGGIILFEPRIDHNCFPTYTTMRRGSVFQCSVCKEYYLRRKKKLWKEKTANGSYFKKLTDRETKKRLLEAIIAVEAKVKRFEEIQSWDNITTEDIRVKETKRLALMSPKATVVNSPGPQVVVAKNVKYQDTERLKTKSTPTTSTDY